MNEEWADVKAVHRWAWKETDRGHLSMVAGEGSSSSSEVHPRPATR
jgi:hypothetical protein